MKLFPHQTSALEKTKDFNRCAYYLDMGLGKTFVGSEKMYDLFTHENIVVCQKSKISDWVDHFKNEYSDFYNVYDLTKKNQFEEFIYGDDIYPRVGVINYDLVWRRKELLNVRNFTLMLDESSMISNETAKRSKFILKMHPSNVILLSGTPCSGKYENLWSQCKLLGWDISKRDFYSNYIVTRKIDLGGFLKDIVVGYRNVEQLKDRLREYGAVFMKTEDAGIMLPDQMEQKIFIQESSDYKKFKKSHYVKIDDEELVGDNSLTKILYERQLCSIYSKNKLTAFEDLIESTNDRLVVFYNFNEELRKLLDIIGSRPFSIINGSQKDLYDYYNFDNSITFVQYQAGAMGLNLQKANKIIYYSLPLGKGSCGLWEQSKKRIHRIGQKKTCFYYYLLVKNSIEEWNLKLLQEGKELTDALFIEKNK